MGRDDLYISVPTFFKCPISLDVMKSPVSLCTGVTYDRSSIQRWLDSGHNTCPATMQVLHTKDFVPNHTLQRLIRIWSDSSQRAHRPNPPSLTQAQVQALITQIIQNQNQNCFQIISKLVSFAKSSDQNVKFLVTLDRFVPFLIEIISNSNWMIANTNYAEETFVLVDLILHEDRDRECIAKLVVEKRDCVISSILFVLKQGSLSSRIATARVLEFIAMDSQSKLYFAEHSDLLNELLRLVSSESDSDAMETGLSTLICISKPKRIRARLIQIGAVKLLAKLLSDSNLSVMANERVLKLLEMVSSCKEGRAEMSEDGACVAAIVKRMLKASAVATEHAVAILWSLCCVFRDSAVQEAVARSNGVTKILLLMQSDCSPAVRQMAGDLLKIFRVNSTSCLSSYDTKTTHIMPF
ncbi:U-box domain-containing protein [Actinidia chinensis var. chinensis]|uniref:U-box domain-containing protein n=1 Tax=Actinidia chinensis var. chinensis TaxID=1590841 RepID=A0A2R6RDL5_ACTCC|nr:U-box domain-containing protein [Actinidia chinensis var. chinensis]